MKKFINLCKEYYSVREAAFLFGKTIHQIKRSIRDKTLNAVRRGKLGWYRIPSNQIFRDRKSFAKKS